MTDVQVASDADIPDVQRLFREYAAWVGVHLSFRFREVAPYRPTLFLGHAFWSSSLSDPSLELQCSADIS